MPDTKRTRTTPPAPADDDVVEAELVDTPGTAVEAHNGDGHQLVTEDEWGDVDDMDLAPDDQVAIPLYQLNRKVGGGFVNEDTGEVEQTIDAVLLAKANTRAYWKDPFGKGDAAPTCRSEDNIVPSDRSIEKQSPTCASCRHSKWEGDDPPACSEAIEFLTFVPTDHGTGRITRLRFSGMGFGPARRYWTSFKMRLPKRPPVAFVTSIDLEEEDTPNGRFLVPRFRRKSELTRADANPVLEARKARVDEWRLAIATDDRAPAPTIEGGEPFPDVDAAVEVPASDLGEGF